jgi:hypothetical protein
VQVGVREAGKRVTAVIWRFHRSLWDDVGVPQKRAVTSAVVYDSA